MGLEVSFLLETPLQHACNEHLAIHIAQASVRQANDPPESADNQDLRVKGM